jgi:tRNA-dihydrouridine synthase B
MPNFKTFRTEMVTADSYAQVCEILNQVSEVYADYEF